MTHPDLSGLGWTPHFARQVDPGEALVPARVAEVRRGDLLCLPGALRLLPPPEPVAVGDWVLHDGAAARRRLRPVTEIARKGAGEGSQRQLVAANVDALGIVTACDGDFSAARVERYLAVAAQAGCLPLVVLTKADLRDPEPLLREARRLSPLVAALALDARDADEVARLHPWAGPGQTLALVGSSGVGKTTIQNALTGTAAATGGVRAGDGKGRHTTTARSLRPALAGGWLIDTPGMREVGLVAAAEGIAAVFADLGDLARACRFSDCRHEGEPGCAVRGAIAAGEVDEDRLRRWRKLAREERANTESLHERHERARAWARMAREGSARSAWKRRGPE